MHVFQADIAAIGMPQRIVEFTDGYPAEAEDAADIDLQVLFTLEAVALEREVFGNFPLGQTEGVEVGGKMAPDAERAHQHHCTIGIVRCFLERLVVELFSGLFGSLGDHHAHLRGIERGGKIRAAVDHFGQPSRIAPAGPLLGTFLVAQLGQEIMAFVTHPGHLLAPTKCRLLMAMPQRRGRSRGGGWPAPGIRQVP